MASSRRPSDVLAGAIGQSNGRSSPARERRHELVEAVLRLVRRDGLDQASVRKVAQEAGLSMGSLRHYFMSQSELMVFAFRTVIDRIESRLATLEPEPDPRRRAERVLAELLPLDDERRAENDLWLAFTCRATVDPALRALLDEGYDALRAGCRAILTDLAEAGLAPADIGTETERLHALLDGPRRACHHAARRPHRRVVAGRHRPSPRCSRGRTVRGTASGRVRGRAVQRDGRSSRCECADHVAALP